MKRIVLGGLKGRMGSFLVEALKAEPDLLLVAGLSKEADFDGEVPIYNNVDELLKEVDFDVYVDFTVYDFAKTTSETMLRAGKNIVIGTTGFKKPDIDYLKVVANQCNVNGIIAPNFSMGAILINKFTEMCSRYFENFEVIEYHHVNKIDKPSGTATYIANTLDCSLKRKLTSTHVHSVRMPGILAKHHVIVSDEHQIIELIHQSNSRHSFEKGIIFAIRKVDEIDGLIYGLNSLLT
ncbi:MAG TPA: 4-hydroxy-tetrahydrodipicolinate reductase [Firmicutes bacterium]|nr:4-hydroxy-tetrahydrodipicolinate reductase [Bacillota bacterium]